MTTNGHDEHRPFETIVKKHVDTGVDISTAIGRAIEEDPEAYGEYLKRQQHNTITLKAMANGYH